MGISFEKPHRDPDLDVDLEFRGRSRVAGIFPCRIWIPHSDEERPALELTDSKGALRSLPDAEHSLLGHVYDLAGKPQTEIRASHVLFPSRVTQFRGRAQSYTVLSGFPRTLLFVTRLPSRSRAKRTRLLVRFTSFTNLQPLTSETQYEDGTVEIKVIVRRKIRLPNRRTIEFRVHRTRPPFTYDRSVNPDRTLVGILSIRQPPIATRQIGAVIEPLWDLAMMASFAARSRVAITGWQAADSRFVLEAYLGTPKPPKPDSWARYHPLIEDAEIVEFVETALRSYESLDNKKRRLLRQALFKIIPGEGQSMESRFLFHFAALESMVRLNQNTTGSGARKLPLAEAFNLFATNTGVQFSDLWPPFENKPGPSLYRVRNMIAHSDNLSPSEGQALLRAGIHLSWLVERVALTLLSWPVERSGAASKHVKTERNLNSPLSRDMQILRSL